MDTFNYQGKPIKRDLVARLSGSTTLNPLQTDFETDEELHYSDGLYYLVRDLSWHGNEDTRLLAHRLSRRAAILWATMRVNAMDWQLRNDVNAMMDAAAAWANCPLAPAFNLDDHAGRLLRDALTSEPGTDPRDMINAAVTFMLTDEADYPDVLHDAKARRAAYEAHPGHAARQNKAKAAFYGVSVKTLEAAGRHAAKSGRTTEEMVAEMLENVAEDDAHTVPLIGEPPIEPEPTEDQEPDFHRFTFDYPATRKHCGIRRVVDLNGEQMVQVQQLAVHFGLTPEQFLRALVHNNNLPGQPHRSGNKIQDALEAEHITFVCSEPEMAKRIERAALAREQTVDEFVAHCVGSDVDMWEECMLVHPATGELLAADEEELYDEVEKTITAPPIGREHEPQFQKQRMWDPQLDKEAAAQVRRYLRLAPKYTAGDVVSGCVDYALTQAFDAIENLVNRAKVLAEGAQFTDDGWGYVEEYVDCARRFRVGEPADEEGDDDAEIAAPVEHTHRLPADSPRLASRNGASDIKALFLSGELAVPAGGASEQNREEAR